MTAASSALADAPWTQRLAETPPWSPWRLALALAIGLFVLFFAAEWSFGRFPLLAGDGPPHRVLDAQVNFRIALVMILLVAYLPAAFADGVRSTRATIAALAPQLRATPETVDALRAQAGRFDARRLRIAGWIGVALAVAIPFWIDRDLYAWAIWMHGTESIFQRILLPSLGWFAGRFIYSVGAESRRLSRVGELVRVDLLDLRPLAPLTRQGLRFALLVVGLMSVLALYLFDYDKRGLFTVVTIAALAALVAAATALLSPLRGARRAIQAEKRAELERCDAALRRARAEQGANAEAGTIADLVAWRTLVSDVPEWLLDAPTLRRFVLYLAIPIGSWLGGSFVDQLVELALR
ncbi:MAG: hypothetical protein MUF70_03855 [Myxococcota bacterium]|jgi:hypothetical protein|nr:hypothetical protein [Myxococcota bacterium]